MFQGIRPLVPTEPIKELPVHPEPRLRFISQFIQNAEFFPSLAIAPKIYLLILAVDICCY